MIATLLITIILEAMVVIGYCCKWRGKPLAPILLTSITGNLITQSLLWIALNLFFRHYLLTLLSAEVLIWILESLFLYSVPANRLRISDAMILSLSMNVMSFALGWFLPV